LKGGMSSTVASFAASDTALSRTFPFLGKADCAGKDGLMVGL
jgi:hypothetical protein